tara:strand:+ start:659 stop:1111 length:453 start_codon:yes stop_codon:yes gene_type:complete
MSISGSLILKKFLVKSIWLLGKPSFKWFEFVFPSTLHLTPFVKLILEPFLGNERFTRIELGLHEALVNSVRHGNLLDPQKFIRVRRIITPNWIVLQIQDEGNGIPTVERISSLPEELEAESGRGLFLIHECFDDVRWSRKGNRIQVSFRL